MIQAYFAQVKEIVDQYGVTNFVLEARVSFELRPAGQGYLTGVFTFADGSALHFREILDTAGEAVEKLVPEDFSVVAIATEKIAQLMTPPLTAVNLPTHVMGYRAAKLIIAQLKQQPVEASQILLPPELVIRGSTGPAPA